MAISNISRVKQITLKVAAEDDEISVIYSSNNLVIGTELIPSYKIISFNCFLKNLRVFANVSSLPEAPLPDFAITDSATAKLTKTLDIEWKSPRKQLNLYITDAANPTLEDWLQVGSISMINPYGYPFRVYNVLDLFTDNLALELGENGKIGVQVQDVGHGLISANDKVTIHGSYMEEIFVEKPAPPTVFNLSVSGVTGNTGGNSGTGSTPTTSFGIGNSGLIDNTYLIGN